MALELTLAIPSPTLTTGESIAVELCLHNGDPHARALSPPDADCPFLAVILRERSGAVLRTVDATTLQTMTSPARPERSLRRAALAAGASLRASFDLAPGLASLPAGEHTLEAVYHDPEAGVELRSAPVPLAVRDPPLRAVSLARDHCVLDALTVLLETDDHGAPAYYLRQLRPARPLGAVYTSRVALPGRGPALLATNSFVRRDGFSHCYQRWVLQVHEGALHARRFSRGVADGAARVAPLPSRRVVCAPAFCTAPDALWVLLLADGVLECCRFDEGALRPVFARDLGELSRAEGARGDALAVAVDPSLVHLAIAAGGTLRYEALAHDGALQQTRVLHDGAGRARALLLDPVTRTLRALLDGAPGAPLVLLHADLAAATVATFAPALDALPGAPRELAFERDAQGRWHLLAGTTDATLHHLPPEGAPRRLATGQAQWFPRVHEGHGIFLGYHLQGEGWRFTGS